MNFNPILAETEIENIDVKSPLEHQVQKQEVKYSAWQFDKINSMTLYFYKTGELNGSNFVKIPSRPNAILNIEKNDKFCFSYLVYIS